MKTPSRRWLAVLAAALAFSAAATGAQEMPMHHRGHHAGMDPALMDKHVDLMVEHLLKDGSADQKSKVAAIAKAAMAELRPMRAQLRANHKQALEILGQGTVDRAALEQVRSAQVQLMDGMSRRVMAAVADASDVLTPEQRKRFANHLHKMHGH